MHGIIEEYGSFIVEVIAGLAVLGVIYGVMDKFGELAIPIAEKVMGV